MKNISAKKEKFNIKQFILNYALYFILAMIIISIIAYDPDFVSANNFLKIIQQASTRGILALGIGGLIILQGTDLSAGRVLGLCAAVSASLLQKPDFVSRMYPDLPYLGLFIPLIIAIVIGALFGLFNGIGVAVLNIHAFIVTLATQLIGFGLINLYINSQAHGAQPIGTLVNDYINLAQGSFIGIPNLIWFLAITATIMWFIWNKTTLGKNMYAIGGNMEAAKVAGINVVKNIIIIYLISGVLYGIAGFLEGARVGSVNANTGFSYELDAISACVVGGVSFNGGVGKISGVIIGALILQVINFGLNFIQLDPNIQYLVRGAIIVIAVAIDVVKYIKKR